MPIVSMGKLVPVPVPTLQGADLAGPWGRRAGRPASGGPSGGGGSTRRGAAARRAPAVGSLRSSGSLVPYVSHISIRKGYLLRARIHHEGNQYASECWWRLACLLQSAPPPKMEEALFRRRLSYALACAAHIGVGGTPAVLAGCATQCTACRVKKVYTITATEAPAGRAACGSVHACVRAWARARSTYFKIYVSLYTSSYIILFYTSHGLDL
jgi:hypothetical protein